MGAVWYLYRRTLFNRVRKAFRKPVTYVYLAVGLFYLTVMPMALRVTAEQFGGSSPSGLTAVLTVITFWLVPGNLIAYSKRKGLVYRNSDVHFLFPSPVSPKRVLVYAHLRTLVVQVVMNLFAVCYGRLMFGAQPWRLGLYFLFAVGVENLLEGGIMLLLYGNERLSGNQRALVVKGAYLLTGVLVIMGITTLAREGFGMHGLSVFLHSDMVQLVPMIGWNVAVLHLIFLGPTTVNLIGSGAYVLLFVVVLVSAWRLRCTGAFYEDAMKFAEDYEEVLASRRQGRTDKRLGKKQHFGKASVRWRGSGAKALFYRQLLEYKKSRFFIFDGLTAVSAVVGFGMAYLYLRTGGFREMGSFEVFLIPMVSAYVIFIFTGFSGKWGKELQFFYTYLIPDSPFRKLIYATAMQHLQSLVNGCLMTLPLAIVSGLSPAITILCILLYVTLSASKLYALAVAEVALGSALGRMGKQLLQMFLQSMAILAAVVAAALGMGSGNVLTAYVLMEVILLLVTGVFMVIAMLNFDHMEA